MKWLHSFSFLSLFISWFPSNFFLCFCFSTLLAFCIIWWCFLHFSFHVLIRSQKEEALHFRLAKCNEVCQLEKVYCLKTASIKPRSESIILSTNKFDKEIFYFFFVPLGALKLFHHYLIIFVSLLSCLSNSTQLQLNGCCLKFHTCTIKRYLFWREKKKENFLSWSCKYYVLE